MQNVYILPTRSTISSFKSKNVVKIYKLTLLHEAALKGQCTDHANNYIQS